MLKHLQLRNFRSIRAARIDFPESGMAVLIGANGAGKTNVVRALEFLPFALANGFDRAVQHAGFRDALTPKAIPRRNLSELSTEISYAIPMPALPDSDLVAEVRHSIRLQWRSFQHFHITHERVEFTEPLAVAAAFAGFFGSHDRSYEKQGEVPSSNLVVSRSGDDVSVDFTPSVTEENFLEYSRWLGSPAFSILRKSSPEEAHLRRLLTEPMSDLTESKSESGPGLRRSWSLLDRRFGLPLLFAPQVTTFLAIVSQIRRFDLQLAELRNEQPISDDEQLTSSGANLPGAWKALSAGSGTLAIEEIQRTMHAVAPHVLGTRTKQLQSRKEFIAFIESRSGRPVESWHASDGTLRALAILVALESSEDRQTLIIEEPEQNLHPWAVRALVDHVRRAISRKNLQVILTTHSPELLACVEPGETFVLQRQPDLGTEIRTLEEVVPAHSIEKGDVGRLWTQGLLGGIPGE